jgi:benzoyl-CoA reductase/2-hydroxyglutaryl-CoA dehydratase subunit BcrC/BadD/HgdB
MTDCSQRQQDSARAGELRDAASGCGSGASCDADSAATPSAWFRRMIPNCLEYASAQKAAGKRIVCIMCEYTPRELLMAAGAVPVCLCGGSAKTIPAAEEHLPANLCPLIKSTYGYHVEANNPFLEMADLVVGETTCDGKKKMFELMAESRPMYVLELPQRADDDDALEHWVLELRKFRDFLEGRFGAAVTEAGLREAIDWRP